MHLETVGGLDALIQPKRGDAENFGQRGLDARLRPGSAGDCSNWRRMESLVCRRTQMMKGIANFVAIGVIQAMKSRELFVRQPVETGACLLGLWNRGSACRRAQLAGKIGMALDQGQLLIAGGALRTAAIIAS